MRAFGMSNGYTTGKIYVVWEIPYDSKLVTYEVYRNGVLIAFSPDSDGNNLFVQPTMFDHDHHTNLFKKDSIFKLMYIDENVNKYQNYEYKIIAKRTNDIGEVIETIESNTITVEAQ